MSRRNQVRATHNTYADLCIYLKQLDEPARTTTLEQLTKDASKAIGTNFSTITVQAALNHMGVELISRGPVYKSRIGEGIKDRAGVVARALAELMTSLGYPIPPELKVIYNRDGPEARARARQAADANEHS